MMRNQEEPALLRLPAELRNMIYRLALDTTYLHLDLSSRCRRINVQLPLVSRQIYAESTPFPAMYTVLCYETPHPGRGGRHPFWRFLKWQKHSFDAARYVSSLICSPAAVLVDDNITGLSCMSAACGNYFHLSSGSCST